MTRDDSTYSTAPDEDETVKGMHNFSPIVLQSPVATVNNTYKKNIDESGEKKTKLTATEFYQTYDPAIGLHTAAVLGGILILLIVYLLYRTKCRKCIIALVKRDKKKKEPQQDKMVIEIEETKCLSFTENGANIGMDENVICDQCLDDCSRQEPYCDYCQLPDIETDMVQATAQWVTDHPVDLESGDPSGIILKVNSKMLLKDGSRKDQWCFENHPSTSAQKVKNLLKYKLNRSLPILNRYTEVPKPKQAKKVKTYQKHQYNAIPMQAENRDHDLSSNDTGESSGTKQPIDLTPIIKIQNYDGLRMKQCRRCSKDTYSSNSSDEYLLQKRILNWKDKSDISNVPGQNDEQEMVQCIKTKQLLYQNNIQMDIKSSETKL